MTGSPAMDGQPGLTGGIRVLKTDAECNPREAGTISLAGLGPQETVAEAIADPDSSGHVHEVAAAGAFSRFSIRCVNKPHATNPKTGYLACWQRLQH